MTGTHLRARVLLEEAHALGVDLADLIAADRAAAARIPTVAAFIETVAPTFTDATAATYRPYWRLAAARFGDRRLIEVTIVSQELSSVRTDAQGRDPAYRSTALGAPGTSVS